MISEFKGDYSFLSNFHPVVGNITVEHLYQASKSTSRIEATTVLLAGTARQAKRLGRVISIREDWHDVKGNIMTGLLWWKFSIPEFRDKLLTTGDQELVEGNTWHDIYWGVCNGGWRCGKHAPEGENMLGKLLMAVRDKV